MGNHNYIPCTDQAELGVHYTVSYYTLVTDSHSTSYNMYCQWTFPHYCHTHTYIHTYRHIYNTCSFKKCCIVSKLIMSAYPGGSPIEGYSPNSSSSIFSSETILRTLCFCLHVSCDNHVITLCIYQTWDHDLSLMRSQRGQGAESAKQSLWKQHLQSKRIQVGVVSRRSLTSMVQLTSTYADFVGLKWENDVTRILAELTHEPFPLADWTGLDVSHCLCQ